MYNFTRIFFKNQLTSKYCQYCIQNAIIARVLKPAFDHQLLIRISYHAFWAIIEKTLPRDDKNR